MSADRIATGVPGLDAIIGGGLRANSLYLLKGAPGAGKTTIAIQFLVEGARLGERCLYISLSETRGQVAELADSFGWDLADLAIHDMRRRGRHQDEGEAYTVFNPAEVELEEISREILEQVDRVRPARLVIDSLSEIRLLAGDAFRYRRELLTLSDRLVERGCTGWLIDVDAPGESNLVAETLASGVIVLEQLPPEYGGERRRLRVRKVRATESLGGYHDFAIGRGGVTVFPRLVASTHRALHSSAAMPSGVEEIDALLGGGIDGGTSTVLLGPSGSGKSTLAAQFVTHAASRGVKGVIFCFDESPTNLLIRTAGLGMPLQKYVDAKIVQLVPVDPAEFSPGELSHRIRAHVEGGHRLVVIDSLNGYLGAMPEERFLSAHLHELLAFLSEKGVATIMTLAQHGLFGPTEAPVSISYVADTVLLLRYFEAAGAVKQAISVDPTVKLFEQANVILLQRPLSPRLLLSAVRAALRARRRQHEMRDLHLRLARAVQLGDTFVSILAHDLRTPVTAAKLAADGILRRSQDPRALDYARSIVSSLLRMNGMIEQLLDFARFRQGRGVRLRLGAANLGDLTREVLREIEVANPRASLRMTVAGDLDGAWDADRLAQVVSNLASNAVQHGVPDRPVSVELDGRDRDVVRLRVTSAGVIPQDEIPSLFEPFRPSTSAKGAGGGLGLGLFIAREITRVHGGDISLRTREDEGLTTFEVTLPRTAKPAQTSVLAAS